MKTIQISCAKNCQNSFNPRLKAIEKPPSNHLDLDKVRLGGRKQWRRRKKEK